MIIRTPRLEAWLIASYGGEILPYPLHTRGVQYHPAQMIRHDRNMMRVACSTSCPTAYSGLAAPRANKSLTCKISSLCSTPESLGGTTDAYASARSLDNFSKAATYPVRIIRISPNLISVPCDSATLLSCSNEIDPDLNGSYVTWFATRQEWKSRSIPRPTIPCSDHAELYSKNGREV